MFSLYFCVVALVIWHANPIFFLSALYCYLGPLWVYQTFPYYLTNATIFREKFTEQDICFVFLYNFRLNIFSF